MLAPYFAPQAAVGVYRSVKLARNLPAEGFRPIVLAGTFPDDAQDEGLLATLPPEVLVRDAYVNPTLASARRALTRLTARRAARPIRGPAEPLRGMDPFHAPVDRYALHAPHAYREAVMLGRTHRVELVYASLGPYSAGEVALRAAQKLQIPLVLDLRDPWSLHETGSRADDEGAVVRAQAALVRRIEARYLEHADHVVINTERALAAYRAAYPDLESKSSCIRNHFDLGLYRDAPIDEPEPGKLRVLHFGTLRADAPIDDLAHALRRLIDRARLTPADVELVQVGRVGAYERDVIERLALEPFFHARPAVPHAEARSTLRSAHVLVVLSTSAIRLRIPAKSYDYAASGMPVLAIADNPELDAVLLARPDSTRVLPGNVERITDVLTRHLAVARATRALPTPAAPPEEHSANRAASRLAAIFARVLQSAGERA
jgi:glycosyltransferase involved in cell wall biosynthesis